MAQRRIQLGITGNGLVLRVKLYDSSVTTRIGKTGLAYTSTGLLIGTIANNEATATAYTTTNLATIATLGTYVNQGTKCGFAEVDATNLPGLYEIHLPASRYGVPDAKALHISIGGVTNLANEDVTIELIPSIEKRSLWG